MYDIDQDDFKLDNLDSNYGSKKSDETSYTFKRKSINTEEENPVPRKRVSSILVVLKRKTFSENLNDL